MTNDETNYETQMYGRLDKPKGVKRGDSIMACVHLTQPTLSPVYWNHVQRHNVTANDGMHLEVDHFVMCSECNQNFGTTTLSWLGPMIYGKGEIKNGH